MTSNDRRGGAAAIGRVLLLAFAVPFLASIFANTVQAEESGAKGTATLSKRDNFARLIIKTNELVASEVTLAGPVLIVRFKKPVDISVSKLAEGLTEYVSVVRRDPDGTAIRFALNQKISVNTMMAGEQLFVDMLPASWRGMPPPLPQEVVQELVDRARAAEQLLVKHTCGRTVYTAPADPCPRLGAADVCPALRRSSGRRRCELRSGAGSVAAVVQQCTQFRSRRRKNCVATADRFDQPAQRH